MNVRICVKYHIVPFGCQMNRSDAERVRTVLESMGFVEAADENDPQIAIKGIIACSVRQKAIDRVYGRILKWNKAKAEKPLITFVSGCVLPADKKKFLKLFDLVFPMDTLPELPQMIRDYGVAIPMNRKTPEGVDLQKEQLKTGGAAALALDSKNRIEEFWKLSPHYASDWEAYVPIQNGCDKFCTYCAVPYTRGREVSRPSQDILAEVHSLVEKGYKSITLLGQNVNSYGLDKKGEEKSFPQLMKAIGELGMESGKEFWVFFTSPHPRDITNELLEVMAAYPVLANWVHFPLQSGDDEVLERMNRRHSMERYREVMGDIRRILPGVSVFTDIIVGFSGETEEQFNHTVDAMREFCYDMAFIAQYSPRPGAKSADWPDDVPKAEKERRFHLLGDELTQAAAPRNLQRVGTIERVLVTGKDRKDGYYSGYTQGRIPVRVSAQGAQLGEFCDVEVVSARPLSIEGVPVHSGGREDGNA